MANKKNKEARKAALIALSDVLWNLTESLDDKRTRALTDEKFFTLVDNIARNDGDLECRTQGIQILPELDDVSAIYTIISVIEKADDNDYSSLKRSIQQAIVWKFDRNRRPRNYLTLHHHPRILKILSNMAAKGNKRASELADEIRRGSGRTRSPPAPRGVRN